ncbi:hypothetical protein Q8F55_008085 [Vanrija albida]|uniref:Borealin N-terminal domain-containing protein n=1 Tax=Vanrija albida TaxID=181172 RepID=A0ABR3PV97_9TREE
MTYLKHAFGVSAPPRLDPDTPPPNPEAGPSSPRRLPEHEFNDRCSRAIRGLHRELDALNDVDDFDELQASQRAYTRHLAELADTLEGGYGKAAGAELIGYLRRVTHGMFFKPVVVACSEHSEDEYYDAVRDPKGKGKAKPVGPAHAAMKPPPRIKFYGESLSPQAGAALLPAGAQSPPKIKFVGRSLSPKSPPRIKFVGDSLKAKLDPRTGEPIDDSWRHTSKRKHGKVEAEPAAEPAPKRQRTPEAAATRRRGRSDAISVHVAPDAVKVETKSLPAPAATSTTAPSLTPAPEVKTEPHSHAASPSSSKRKRQPESDDRPASNLTATRADADAKPVLLAAAEPKPKRQRTPTPEEAAAAEALSWLSSRSPAPHVPHQPAPVGPAPVPALPSQPAPALRRSARRRAPVLAATC